MWWSPGSHYSAPKLLSACAPTFLYYGACDDVRVQLEVAVRATLGFWILAREVFDCEVVGGALGSDVRGIDTPGTSVRSLHAYICIHASMIVWLHDCIPDSGNGSS